MATRSKKLTAEELKALEARLIELTRAGNAKLMMSRVCHGLGLYVTCGRCGGGGNYSYCQMYGTTCFGCGGSGKLIPKITPALVAEVEAKVAAGELDVYLERVRARQAAAVFVKGAADRARKACAALPCNVKVADVPWMKVSEHRTRAEQIASHYGHALLEAVKSHAIACDWISKNPHNPDAIDHVRAYHLAAIERYIAAIPGVEADTVAYLEANAWDTRCWTEVSAELGRLARIRISGRPYLNR